MSSDLDLIDRGTIDFSGIDKELFETTDLGKFGEYRGEMVPLDLPIKNIVGVNEAEYKGKKVELNKPISSLSATSSNLTPHSQHE